MKIFTVDVFAYPKTYEIRADSEDEAKNRAKERFYDDTHKSVYTTEVDEGQEVSQNLFDHALKVSESK